MTGSWDSWFLSLCEAVATKSKDPSTKVGSIIVDPYNRVVSVGYNGFPRAVLDIAKRYADRTQKYSRVIHAELNAILFSRRDLEGCTIYTTPFPPCNDCAKAIIQCQIKRVVSYLDHIHNERWADSFKISEEMYQEAGVSLCLVPKNGVMI
jgi:dCMP deaminase